jgi:hypothetical protein
VHAHTQTKKGAKVLRADCSPQTATAEVNSYLALFGFLFACLVSPKQRKGMPSGVAIITLCDCGIL